MVSRELGVTGSCAGSGGSETFVTYGAATGAVLAVVMLGLGWGEGRDRWMWGVAGFLAPLFWAYGEASC